MYCTCTYTLTFHVVHDRGALQVGLIFKMSLHIIFIPGFQSAPALAPQARDFGIRFQDFRLVAMHAGQL